MLTNKGLTLFSFGHVIILYYHTENTISKIIFRYKYNYTKLKRMYNAHW